MKVIIDCDPGADDMEAIIMAIAAKHVEIVAITTVAGNSFADQTYINTKKILYQCNRTDIPLYKGTRTNTFGDIVVTDNYFGADGFCQMDLKFEEAVDNQLQQKLNSAQALLHYTKMYPGKIHLIAIGPLTNLAIAYLVDSSFPERLASLTVMGGDRSTITKNNVTSYAEFNCYCDPPAWKLVITNFKLAENKKIKLIDFKFCVDHSLPPPFLNSYYLNPLSQDPNNKKAMMVKMIYDFMVRKFTKMEDITADPFAVFVCVYPDYNVTGRAAVLKNIDMEGEKRGHTEFRYDDSGNLLLIDDIEFKHFQRIMLNSLE